MDETIVLFYENTKNEQSKDKPECFTTTFETPLILDSKYDYYIGLKSLTMENSWYNISKKLDNHKIILEKKEKEKRELIFKDGNYTLTDINNFIAESFNIFDYNYKKLPFVFGIDNPTSKCILRINEKDSIVDFSHSNFYKLLGFDKRRYSLANKNIYAENRANISNGVDRIFIHCSIAEGAYHNETKINEKIYDFATKNKPGSQIIIEEMFPEYYKVISSANKTITEIKMFITDQNFKLINLNGSKVFYKLILKKLKK